MSVTSLPLFASPAIPSPNVVISQVYSGGGNSGAPYQNDFIELFNRGSASINLNGWTIQYAPASSSSWVSTTLTGTLTPGRYFLVKQNSGGAVGSMLPVADVTGTINLSSSAGKIALVNNAVLLSSTCPLSTTTGIIDFVGYGTGGSGANCFEGTGAAPSPSNTTADLRKNDGCIDTDDNSADFVSGSGNPPNPRNTLTPMKSCAPRPAEKILISEVMYDGNQLDEGDEFIELMNPLTKTVDLADYKIGDEETKGGGEGMYLFPIGSIITPNTTILVARNAAQFRNRFGFDPNFELVTTGVLIDTASVSNLAKYTTWATGSFSLANDGDEVLLLGPSDEVVDTVAWSNGNFATTGLRGHSSAAEPQSLQRYGTSDTNSMTYDFLNNLPSPGTLVSSLSLPPRPKPGTTMPNGMVAYWGDLHSHSTVSDGSGPPRMAFDTARMNGLHFFALTDHDTTMTQEDWDEMGKAALSVTQDDVFIGLRGFEYTNSKGHLNVFGTNTWVSHNDANYDTLSEMFAWLSAQSGAAAQFNHPDWQHGGDFDNFAFNATVIDKIVLQEVGNNAQGEYARFDSQYPTSLSKRWHVAPTNNSDNHELNWGSDSSHRVGVIAPSLTQANLFDAFRARRVFSTEDGNLAIALQSNGAWMGSTITAKPIISFTVTLIDPEIEPVQLFLYDNGNIVRSQSFASSTATWTVSLPGSESHYFFVRAVQADGDIAYTAPIWTDATPLPTPIVPTETPAPKRWDAGSVSVDTARTTGAFRYVDLEACVTVPPGVFSTSYMFIQDDTGGIKVYMSSKRGDFPEMVIGDRVALRAQVPLSTGEREVRIEDAGSIQLRGKCGALQPARFATGSISVAVEGRLVEVRGNIVSTDRGEFSLDDGSGEVLVYIDTTTQIRLPSIARGQTARIIGVVSRAHGRFAILPRFNSDLEFGARPNATPTRTATRANPTATSSMTPTLTVIPTNTLSPRAVIDVATPRAFIQPTPEPVADLSIRIDAQAIAVVGATTSASASFVMFALALMLWRRQK